MMVIIARGAQVILRAASCQCSATYDELECHACDTFHAFKRW
jgi:hypothetical protein